MQTDLAVDIRELISHKLIARNATLGNDLWPLQIIGEMII